MLSSFPDRREEYKRTYFNEKRSKHIMVEVSLKPACLYNPLPLGGGLRYTILEASNSTRLEPATCILQAGILYTPLR